MEPPNGPEDLEHRYALRRALLNSSRFESNRFRIVWTRLFTYTTTLVAGTAIIAVLVVSVVTVELPGAASSAVSSSAMPAAQLVHAASPAMPFVEASKASQSRVPIELASFSERPEVRRVMQFAAPDIQFAVSR